jgi:hypothetical protein
VARRFGKRGFSLDETDIIGMSVDAVTSIVASKPQFPFLQGISFPVRDLQHPTWSKPFSLVVTAQAPEPLEEIISADADGRLCVRPCVVIMRKHGPQIVLVMFVDDRPVGQIVPSTDNRSLQLDICTVAVVQRLDTLSFPKITSGRIDYAVRPRWEWRQ